MNDQQKIELALKHIQEPFYFVEGLTEREWDEYGDFWWRAGIAAQNRAPVPTVDEGPQFTALPLAPSPEDVAAIRTVVSYAKQCVGVLPADVIRSPQLTHLTEAIRVLERLLGKEADRDQDRM